MTLVIAGSTGFIGRHLLRRCRDSSIDTLLLVRPGQVNSPFGHGVDVVDLLEATQHLPSRSDLEDTCLVHLIGASRDSSQASVWHSNVETTRVLIGIAEAAGLRRILYLSGYGVTLDSSDAYLPPAVGREQPLRAQPATPASGRLGSGRGSAAARGPCDGPRPGTGSGPGRCEWPPAAAQQCGRRPAARRAITPLWALQTPAARRAPSATSPTFHTPA